MGLPSPEQASTWGGKMLVDREGAAIGTVTQIYNDNATGLPEWATIRLGEATVFLPLLDAVEADGQVRVRVRRDDVAKAPMAGPGRRITEQEEARLYQYYGIDYTPERSPSGLPRGSVRSEPRRAAPRRARALELVPLARGGDDRGCGGHRRARSSRSAAPFVAPAVVVRQAGISGCAARNSQRRERRNDFCTSTPPSPAASDRYSGDSTGQSATRSCSSNTRPQP